MSVVWVPCQHSSDCENLAPKSKSGNESLCDVHCQELENKQMKLAIAASLVCVPVPAPAAAATGSNEFTWAIGSGEAMNINRLFEALNQCPDTESPLYFSISEAIKVALNIA